MKKEHQMELKTPIKYAYKGDEVEGKFLTLLPPSFKHAQQTTPLKQAFYRAAFGLRNEGEGRERKNVDASEEINGKDVIQMIYSSGEDATKFILHGVELITSGLVMVEGVQRLTKPLLEQFETEVVEEIIGEYLVNFILDSLLLEMSEGSG